MGQLSINTEPGLKTASAEAQDQQRLHQEQQRLATEQELARKREERLQMAQQRQRQELLHREQLKKEYQRQQEKVARQREDQTKQQLQQQKQKQQQQSTLLEPRKGLSISEWAIGVNSPELMPEDSLSSREWEPAHSRFYMEEDPNPTDRYLPSKKTVVCAMPETIPTPIHPISTTAAPIESITVKEDINVMQNSHHKWVQQVTALAWTIRVHKADSRYDTSNLQDQLRRKLEEGSPWSTFGVMIGKLCL